MCMFSSAPSPPPPPVPPPSRSDADVAAAELAARQRRSRAVGRSALILTDQIAAPIPATGNAKKLLGE
jgi:hypothetical protein